MGQLASQATAEPHQAVWSRCQLRSHLEAQLGKDPLSHSHGSWQHLVPCSYQIHDNFLLQGQQ